MFQVLFSSNVPTVLLLEYVKCCSKIEQTDCFSLIKSWQTCGGGLQLNWLYLYSAFTRPTAKHIHWQIHANVSPAQSQWSLTLTHLQELCGIRCKGWGSTHQHPDQLYHVSQSRRWSFPVDPVIVTCMLASQSLNSEPQQAHVRR